jgi:medium-chain acyl-[acyl-carrier-protein] hydrolase
MVPVARVPVQDLRPWEDAIRKLTTDEAHWNEIAARSRAAALDYAAKLSVEPFERLLADVVAKPKRSAAASKPLSASRQALLDRRLRQRAWFPTADPSAKAEIRLFCFPHAGAGTLLYRSWATELAPAVEVCPALLPGRESRANEPPAERIEELVSSLTAAIRTLLDRPFAFFGHSMGAGIAFELARSLRRAGLRLPVALFVSGARAPQYRLNWQPGPEPTDAELLDQLRRLEGLPADDSLRLALPLLRADTSLYRHYVYTPEPPLDIPIFAYGGDGDPNVRPEHLDAWREQTTALFERREFPGGHFYLRANQPELLEALRADLQAGFTADS